ncbi:hypothetical protein H4687_002884 [Streptomyces stelliscabiei]|uniref:Uncharacterized protein n=1 Tax=Streptomyces stelliscabiei TaxID=146820 RepID=A0A8I0P211_9ACTN|nr:hypothetical protein [Streptomyces stelliscabiei]
MRRQSRSPRHPAPLVADERGFAVPGTARAEAEGQAGAGTGAGAPAYPSAAPRPCLSPSTSAAANVSPSGRSA